MDFAVPADHRVKLKESEKNKYLDLAKELKKNKKMWNMGLGELGNNRTSGNHLNYYIIEIGQNTEKSRGDLL